MVELGTWQSPCLGSRGGGGAPGRSRVLAFQNLQVYCLELWTLTFSPKDGVIQQRVVLGITSICTSNGIHGQARTQGGGFGVNPPPSSFVYVYVLCMFFWKPPPPF